MELVNILAARAGQILARSVTNAAGAVLCPPGFRLSETAIDRLKNAGVESLLVESGETGGPSVQERIAALHQRFEGIEDPIMLQIKATIENRLSFMRLERDESV